MLMSDRRRTLAPYSGMVFDVDEMTEKIITRGYEFGDRESVIVTVACLSIPRAVEVYR